MDVAQIAAGTLDLFDAIDPAPNWDVVLACRVATGDRCSIQFLMATGEVRVWEFDMPLG